MTRKSQRRMMVAQNGVPEPNDWGAQQAASQDYALRASGTYVPRKTSRNGVLVFQIALFLAVCAAVLAVAWAVGKGEAPGLAAIALAVLCGLLALGAVHIALPWEKVVVLRLGAFNRVAGPGPYLTIPIIEHGTIRVDQRTIATPFYAERTLTADLVPITVDAVLFWVVWDVEKACTEVEDYYAAIGFLAQTALREAVGRSTVAEVALRRNQLDQEIEADIEKKAADWGLDVIAVKVRDIVIPEALQDTMSLEAQADREANARMTVAAAETDLADMLAEAARAYGSEDAALKLRTMLMQYETVKASGGTVVTVPTAVSDGFTDAVARESGTN